MTEQEVKALLPKRKNIGLKEPLRPRRVNMRVLSIPIASVFWDSVLQGNFEDQRGFPGYKSRCTYTEGGVTYLKPFDAIRFFRGRQWATLELKDIKCDGETIEFYCGKVIESHE